MASPAFDRESETWRQVRAVLDTLTRNATDQIASPLCGDRDTQFFRGVLMAAREIAALAQPAPDAVPVTTELY